jgi:chaperonin GroEL
MGEIEFSPKDKLKEGVRKLAQAVGSTMGPNGATVIIPDKDKFNSYKITKDGVSVAREIRFKDPIENIGAKLIKEVAELQVQQAGDGTTTAIVLASAFIENLFEFEYNDIEKAFDEIIPKVLKQLKANSKELKKENVKYVATISANNDSKIGDLIQKAYNFSNLVKAEKGISQEDKLDLVDGMKLLSTYFSKNFITNKEKAECNLETPNVLLIDGKLEDLKPYTGIIETKATNGQSLVIVTEHISDKELRKLEAHVLSKNIKLCVIKTPGFGQFRKDILRDLSDFTGASVINNPKGDVSISALGKLKSIKVTNDSALLVKDDSINVTELIESLKILSKNLTSYDKEQVDKRIEQLTGKVAVIYVGGGSELERDERFDRYDDAIKAVACALEEGIVEGGGYALADVQKIIYEDFYQYKNNSNIINNLLLVSLVKPWNTIVNNGYINVKSNTMFEQNIIDPLKVTRCALENAVSVAKTILSTKTVVLNEQEWN